ncbi:MAG: site-2 protease family protein [Tissierellia bacterium]|nr:site-2 protease family protein [Tissierellia bacterium]
MNKNPIETAIYVISFIIAVVFHEYAHGYAAYKLGDPTAKHAGRLTLNPLAHVDPVGLLAMLIFRIGWAKGVPINPLYFKKRKRDTIIVSIAGIVTNFLIAIIASILFRLTIIPNSYFYQFLFILAYVNIMLGVFNLLPFPPLDGSKILFSLLPNKIEYFFTKNERYFYLILMILIFTNRISSIIWPIVTKIVEVLFF